MMLVKSGDRVAHNMHPAPIRSKEFGMALAPNDRTDVKYVYDKAERLPVTFRYDLHPFMKAYHLTQDHPFMAITDDKGEFEIPSVPDGTHSFVIWHEVPGYLEQTFDVTVTAGKVTRLDLSYSPKRFGVK